MSEYIGAVRWDTLHNDITRAWSVMNNGLPMNGWDASHVTDAVCFRLRDLGMNILDVPANCMGHDPRTQAVSAPPQGSPAVADVIRAAETGWGRLPHAEHEQIEALVAEVHRLREYLRRLLLRLLPPLPTQAEVDYARQMLPPA